MAYYGLGSKVAIMQNIYNVCAAISGIKFVDFQRIYDTGIGPEKYPGCFVNDIIETKDQVLRDIVRNTLSIGVPCWVRITEAQAGTLWTAMNTWAQAIILAIMTDPYRSNNAYSTRVTQVETDMGSRHPTGVVVMIFEIVYFSVR